MNQDYSTEFLKDLVNLLHRHGPEPFVRLAATLADPKERKKLVEGLRDLATVAGEMQLQQRPRTKQRSTRRSDAEKARSLLEELSQSDTQKAELLGRLYGELKSRCILSSRNDVLEFCSVLQFQVSSSVQRNKLLLPILRHLAKLPLQEVQIAYDKALSASGDTGEDYRLLANAIMKQPEDF